MGTVGLLMIDCWIWISWAISSGLVRMLLYLYIMQSKGGDSLSLKTFCLFFWDFCHIVVGILIWFF